LSRDNGKPQVNISSLGGDLALSALSNKYCPNSKRGSGLVFGNIATGTAERMLSGVILELVLRKLPRSKGQKLLSSISLRNLWLPSRVLRVAG
jgi:hypothetical protein